MTPKITDNSQKLETIVFGELQDKQKRKQCLTETVKYTCQIKNCSKSKNLFYRIKILRYIKIFKIRDTIELSWYKCYADCSRLNPGAWRKHLTIHRSWLATWLLVKVGCVSCLLQNEGKWGCGTGVAGVYLLTVGDGEWFFANPCVEICRRWINWERIDWLPGYLWDVSVPVLLSMWIWLQSWTW